MPAVAPELRYAVTQLDGLRFRDATGPDASGDGSIVLEGYAAVYNQETTLYDGGFFRMREVIQPGAFTDVLSRNPDVHMVIGHNLDFPLARTGITGVGGLELMEDPRGLRVFARMNPNVSYVRDLAEMMRDGVVDQMSFAFTVDQDQVMTSTLPDGREDELRTIIRVKDLYDVTVTPQGAYSQTSAAVRSLAALSRRAPNGAGASTVADFGRGGDAVADECRGGVERAKQLAAIRARARAAIHNHPAKENTQ